MKLPPGARILEMGSGYGSLSMHLALMDYELTCVDVSRDLLQLVQRRAHQLGLSIKTICSEMAAIDPGVRYDAVLFHESFHHCLDHQLLVSRLDELVVPGGYVFFAAEPIVDSVTDNGVQLVPYPWGLRMDGLSLISTRRWGWMELGFQQSYFLDLLSRSGWECDFSSLDECFLARIYSARRILDKYTWPMYFRVSEDTLCTEIGRSDSSRIFSDGAREGFVQFGFYARIPPGCYRATWIGKLHTTDVRRSGIGHADAATCNAMNVVAKKDLSAPARASVDSDESIAVLDFSLGEHVSDLELRLFTVPGVFVSLSHIRLDQIDKVG